MQMKSSVREMTLHSNAPDVEATMSVTIHLQKWSSNQTKGSLPWRIWDACQTVVSVLHGPV